MKKLWVSLLAMLLAGALLLGAWAEAVVEDGVFYEEEYEWEEAPEEVEEFTIGDAVLEDEESSGDEDTSIPVGSDRYAGFAWDEEDSYESEDGAFMVMAAPQSYNTYNIHGKTVAANSVASPGNGQCWEYANQIYYIIWGVRFGSDFNGSAKPGANFLRNLSSNERTLTSDHIRAFIGASELGSSIRITACNPECTNWNGDGCATHNYGHNLILVAKSSSGFTTFDNWDGAVREKTWTWDSFCSEMSGKYPNIKYIKWPNAPEYKKEEYNAVPDQPEVSVSPTNNGQSTLFSWAAGNNTSYYDIHIRDLQGNTVLDGTTGKETSYTASLPVGLYYVYVGAVNTNADPWKSKDSDYVLFGVSERNAIPGKPAISVAATDNQHETVFTWKRVANADHYDIHILDSNDSKVIEATIYMNTQYSVILKSGKYTAYVGAVNSYANEWKWNDSERVSFTIKNSYPYPDKPTLSVKATNDKNDVEFSWNATNNTTYYDLHICDSNGILLTTDSVGKSTSFKKRMSSGTYWAYVGAVNADVPEWTTNDSAKVKFVVSVYGTEHNHTPIIVKGKAATCTATGLTDGTKCSVCGEWITKQQTIAKKAHTPVTVKGKAATCTATGLTDGTKCSVCGEWITKQQTIAKKGHTPVTVKGYAATYAKAGQTDGTKCSVCGAWITPQTAIDRKVYPGSNLAKKGKNGTITVNIGEQFQLTPQFATTAKVTVKGYKSSKKKVATVDGSGIVTAKTEGKATITVSTSNKKKKATVIVKVVDPYKPTGVSITSATKTVKVGQTLPLGAVLKPATAQSGVTWKSGNKKIATVDKNGVVTAKKKGKVKITVTTAKGKKKATITIKVVP